MIRLTRLADYAVLLLTHMALEDERQKGRVHTAADLARETHVPAPTVSKLLGLMSRGGLLASQRGHSGGYVLAVSPSEISAADIISVVDGPIALTECIEDAPGECGIESLCGVRGAWQRINGAIRNALDGVTLAELIEDQKSVFLGSTADRVPEDAKAG
ncbi:MAG: SUF system Fe-S cluster assembly regulator [Alphaproteobacteria bacterium]|nr:SUF system Fe-S cluster assembly regulator [Alphaproteobacteria bacterium]